MAFANIVYSCHVLSVPEKLIRDLICALVDTYLEDVSTVDITATYVNLLGAIPVVGDHVVVWSRAIGILSPFLFATQKFNLIVGAL